uniref:Uncharacterized protein n=1 Tax=Jakoba libera TaxID=143017 RepID=M4QCE5_JAKLI|nr:hypothetical protein L048_p032 [Jakoba libera]AGH24224.1 hypothetical protein [Jakoba libera]
MYIFKRLLLVLHFGSLLFVFKWISFLFYFLRSRLESVFFILLFP